jgi:hypothetical protein
MTNLEDSIMDHFKGERVIVTEKGQDRDFWDSVSVLS